MILRFIMIQAIATLLVVPVFAGNEKNYTYLALGDSIPYGYDPTVAVPASDKFIGYPNIVAQIEHLGQSKKQINASCPGQTSASFLFGGVDYGCQWFKDNIGLHKTYEGTQADFAVSQLLSNKHINIITLSIGGSDLLMLEQKCSTAPSFEDCVRADLPAVLEAYGQNLTQILMTLRIQANYNGTLILVKYHAPNANPLYIQAVGALNHVMTLVGSQFEAKFADGFGAFQLASALHDGDPCKAGLLIRMSATTCDSHPSPAGRDLLAATVALALNSK